MSVRQPGRGLGVRPHTRFHLLAPAGAERPAASRKRIRTYILPHNFIKGHILRGCEGCNELPACSGGRWQHRGTRVQWNPFNEGSRPAAGALKDHFRRSFVAYDTNMSHSLGFSKDNKANLKCVFFPDIVYLVETVISIENYIILPENWHSGVHFGVD